MEKIPEDKEQPINNQNEEESEMEKSEPEYTRREILQIQDERETSDKDLRDRGAKRVVDKDMAEPRLSVTKRQVEDARSDMEWQLHPEKETTLKDVIKKFNSLLRRGTVVATFSIYSDDGHLGPDRSAGGGGTADRLSIKNDCLVVESDGREYEAAQLKHLRMITYYKRDKEGVHGEKIVFWERDK